MLALLVGSAAVVATVVAMREAPESDEMDLGAGDGQPTATGRLTDGERPPPDGLDSAVR